MPTLLLLDVSLSMLRNVDESQTELSRKRLAVDGLNYLIEKFSHLKLDFASLAFFAEDAEIVVDFTKDYSTLTEALKQKSDLRTKTDYKKAFSLAISHCLTIWGGNCVCQCVVVTDFSEEISRQNSTTSAMAAELEEILKTSNVRFHICLLSPRQNRQAKYPFGDNINFFQDIVLKNKAGGEIHYLNGTVSDKVTKADTIFNFKSIIDRIYESHLSPLRTKLKCGMLTSQILVHPKIETYHGCSDFETIERRLADEQHIGIFGFMKPAELANPPVLSKHLILAAPASKSENSDPNRTKGYHDDDKIPNLCVLLHGSIVTDDSVAICHLGSDWFGYIYFWSLNKRSNLVLHCFQPGFDSVPWIGNFNRLAMKPFNMQINAPKPPPPKTKPSYATNNSSWVQNYGLQSDLQKLIRYMKKFPEKESAFYQELNRIANYAMALGAVDLMVHFLEKEKQNSPLNSNQSKHLGHVIKYISHGKLKYGEQVLPM